MRATEEMAEAVEISRYWRAVAEVDGRNTLPWEQRFEPRCILERVAFPRRYTADPMLASLTGTSWEHHAALQAGVGALEGKLDALASRGSSPSDRLVQEACISRPGREYTLMMQVRSS